MKTFELERYTAPDFEAEALRSAPDARLLPAPRDGVAPEGYHAMSVFPEYFHLDGRWLLAEESRMDCVPVYENGRVAVREFRSLKKGDLVVCGRTENGEEGIYVHTGGFAEETAPQEAFSPEPRNPRNEVYAHSRSSSFGEEMNSPEAPQKVPFWRFTKKMSSPRMSSGSTPADSARISRIFPGAAPSQSTGSISVWTLRGTPSLAFRFIWIAREGIIRRSLSAYASLQAIFPFSRTSRRPAAESGRSNQVEHSIPPYFSIFSFV